MKRVKEMLENPIYSNMITIKTRKRSNLFELCHRKIKNRIFITAWILIGTLVYNNVNAQVFTFDKKKWDTSGHYRYEVSKKQEFITYLRSLNKKQLRKQLGRPNFCDKDGISVYYCLDLERNPKRTSICIGSTLIVYFEGQKIVDIFMSLAGG